MNLTTINKSGRSAFHAAGYKGGNVTVALIDSGCNLRDSRIICVPGFDAPDVEGHGTMIAALLLDWLPECKIFSYNYKGSTAFGSATNAMRDIILRSKQGGRYLVNISQDFRYDAEHEQLINELVARNVPVFAAAGNDGGEGIGIYPSHYQAPICVAALNNDGSRANFSTFHGEMDFAEVGTGVSVTVNGKMGVYNGTSVACPIMLAKAALIMCEQPTITEPQLYAALKAAAVDLGAAGLDPYTGWGHVAPKPKAKGKEEGQVANKQLIPQLITWLHVMLGDVYGWGAQGEDLTAMADPEGWLKKIETSAVNAERAIALYRKRKTEGRRPIRAYDCSGLIVRWLLDNGVITADMSSRGLYSACIAIDRTDLLPGDFVFRHNGTKIYHVGVYIGDGEVIESKGRDDGVVKRPFDASGKTYWNRFGRFPGLQEETKEEPKIPMIIKKDLTYNPAMKAYQKALNLMGYTSLDGKKLDEDGKAGDKTIEAHNAFMAANGVPVSVEVPAALPDTLTLAIEVSGKKYGLNIKAE